MPRKQPSRSPLPNRLQCSRNHNRTNGPSPRHLLLRNNRIKPSLLPNSNTRNHRSPSKLPRLKPPRKLTDVRPNLLSNSHNNNLPTRRNSSHRRSKWCAEHGPRSWNF